MVRRARCSLRLCVCLCVRLCVSVCLCVRPVFLSQMSGPGRFLQSVRTLRDYAAKGCWEAQVGAGGAVGAAGGRFGLAHYSEAL